MVTEHRGFTLIEVLVALTIGALVVLMVHQSFGSAAAVVDRLDNTRRLHRTRMDAEERLTEGFGSLEAGTAAGTGFEGAENRVEFSRAGGSGGRRIGRPERLVLRVQDSLLLLGNEPLLAANDVAFDYLLSYGAQASWVRSWHSPVSAPLAVRMRLERGPTTDTLLFFIGPRG